MVIVIKNNYSNYSLNLKIVCSEVIKDRNEIAIWSDEVNSVVSLHT